MRTKLEHFVTFAANYGKMALLQQFKPSCPLDVVAPANKLSRQRIEGPREVVVSRLNLITLLSASLRFKEAEKVVTLRAPGFKDADSKQVTMNPQFTVANVNLY